MNRLSLLLLFVLLSACASDPKIDTSPDAELSFDGLSPIRNAAFQRAWIDPDTDLSHYDKILLGQTDFQFRTERQTTSSATVRQGQVQEFYITEENRARLIQTVEDAFRTELEASRSFTLTDEPGPTTLILVGGLSDIVSRVPPRSTGSANLFLQSLGAATLVFELRDSLSGEVLYRAADRQQIERQQGQIQATPAIGWEEVRRWARRWAVRLRDGLDSVHE